MFRLPRDPVNKTEGMAVHWSRHIVFALDFLLPALILAAGTWLIRARGLDLMIQDFFYSGTGNWLGNHIRLFDHIYDFGTLPALILAIAGLAVFVLGFFTPNAAQWRRSGLFLALVMLLGPGLLVNAVFKQHWGRPRPNQLAIYEGQFAYEAPLTIDPGSSGEAFPSGHASMGFYFFTLYFIFRGRKKRLTTWAFVLSLLYGFGMGLVRVAQGGHFASDILWSGGMVWFSCALLYYLLKMDRLVFVKFPAPDQPVPEDPKPVIPAAEE
ncbi:MAG: phosphatase PAP2 family protein [Candidatus Cloacimonetes bacterium]|nr:phosphatase PAP2 family protein [Candidatus Cloacimonadota bacterium]